MDTTTQLKIVIGTISWAVATLAPSAAQHSKRRDMNTIYCPACGETTEVAELTITPGINIRWECPHCHTKWLIETDYREDE